MGSGQGHQPGPGELAAEHKMDACNDEDEQEEDGKMENNVS